MTLGVLHEFVSLMPDGLLSAVKSTGERCNQFQVDKIKLCLFSHILTAGAQEAPGPLWLFPGWIYRSGRLQLEEDMVMVAGLGGQDVLFGCSASQSEQRHRLDL